MADDDLRITHNRAAWNEASEHHRKARGTTLEQSFANETYHTFHRAGDEHVLAALERQHLVGATVAQLCCNNGRELLSLLRLGAARGTGFDISDAAIEEARELAGATALPAELVQANVLDIGPEYDGRFDLVFISEGSLQWFPNLVEYFAVVSRLLRAGGRVVVYEIHPFGFLFQAPMVATADALGSVISMQDVLSYFERGPHAFRDGLDYVGNTTYSAKPNHWFLHRLSDVINALLRNGFAIERMDELNHDVASGRAMGGLAKLPLCYLLELRKTTG